MGGENQLDGRREKDTELLQIKDFTKYKKIDGFTRPLPQLYSRKDDCCGCGACYAVCPIERFSYDGVEIDANKSEERQGLSYGAISMEEDEEGFLYPVVDANFCIRCYRCVDVCPIKMADSHRDV